MELLHHHLRDDAAVHDLLYDLALVVGRLPLEFGEAALSAHGRFEIGIATEGRV